ncbi:MAG: MFS transporter [Actinomycetota bacterium]|nr:MFS transporter [Actinomycetota bacterium]
MSTPIGPDTPAPERPRRWLTRGIAGVALSSLFSDTGHELTTSILPSFITVTLHSTASALGLIEGLSNGLMGLATLIAGPRADEPESRLRLASGGYLATAVATGAIGLAATVWQAGALRAAAWLGRGVRSPARDATLASLASQDAHGRAFGLERAGDNLGAVAGPLLAAGLVAWLGVRPALYLAAIPGVFAVFAITIAAREARARPTATPQRRRMRSQLHSIRAAGVAPLLLPISAFELGNMATTLLILRATGLLRADGYSVAAATTLAVLVYAAHNLLATIAAAAGGHWLDRRGSRAPFALGASLYVLSYLLFAVGGHGWLTLVPAFLLAGSGIGLAETAESAVVAGVLPDALRGSGFGLLGGIRSLGALTSSAVVGLLWTTVSPTAGFLYATGWMAVAALGSGALRRRLPGGTVSANGRA